jgi:molybdopterin biosynthesis enzyme
LTPRGPAFEERAADRLEPGATQRRILAAQRSAVASDVLVTVGGASLGEADPVKRALDTAGFQPDFWRVRMRPGSPLSFGWLLRGSGAQPVFGLPGNRASAIVTFEVFVRPSLLRMAGHRRLHRRRLRCHAGEELQGGDRTGLLRVALGTGPGIAAGETLDVVLLDPAPAATDVSPLEGLGP